MKYKLSYNSVILIAILLLALVIRVYFAATFPNILWPDEIFQTLEQGHRLAFDYGVIPWEFRDGIRSWVFPGLIGGIMKLTSWMGPGSDGYIAGVRVFLCLLSLIPVGVGYGIGYRIGGLRSAIIAAGVCLVWFELIYFAPKALNEVVSAYLLIAAVYLGFYGDSIFKGWGLNEVIENRIRFFLTGCLLGLVIVLRIHLILAVAFAVYWLAKKNGLKILSPLLLGILIPFLMAGLLDGLTWSYPFQTFWKNAWVNIIERKAETWGISPWYEYLKMILRSWSIAVIPIAFLAVIGARRSPILAALSLIILISHSFIGHKEYRFIYPCISMIIILAGLGTAELVSQRQVANPNQARLRKFPLRQSFIVILIPLILWLSTSLILGRVYDISQPFKSARLWSNPGSTYWQQQSGNIRSFSYLSKEQNVCGVGLQGIDWWWSAGYAYLHQNVNIFLLKDDAEAQKLEPSFNFLVAPPQSQSNSEYTLQQCWEGICVYKRPGNCSQVNDYHINKYLEETGQ